MRLEYQYVTDEIELDKAMDICRNANVLALDTEFLRTKTYYPDLGLLQVSDGEHCFLFDPLILDLNIFSEILLNKNITKVLHSCSEVSQKKYSNRGLTDQTKSNARHR